MSLDERFKMLYNLYHSKSKLKNVPFIYEYGEKILVEYEKQDSILSFFKILYIGLNQNHQ